MSVQVQFRRGNTAQHSTFTGAPGEITVDTDKNVIVVHDGVKASGYPLAPNISFDVANAAFNISNTLSGNLVNVSVSSNNYAGFMANSANGYGETIVAANLVTSRAYTNTSTEAANNYAGVMANGAGTISNAAFAAANQAGVIANAAFASSNSEYSFSNLVYDAVNSVFSVANAAYGNANSVSVSANNYAGFMANAANGYTETIVAANLITARAYTNTSTTAANNYAGAMANAANSYAASLTPDLSPAFNKANSAYTVANAAFDKANTVASDLSNTAVSANNYASSQAGQAGVIANSAFAAANQSGVVANNANTYADSTYVKKAGDTITGDLVVQGNLTTTGAVTYTNTQTLLIGDAVITLNNDIPVGVAPSEDAGIEIKRGSSSNVSLLWNEGLDKWTFTNDGTNYRLIASNTDVEAANNYAGTMANAANSIASATYATITTVATNATSANNYAGVMANSANGYAETIIAANLITARAYTNTSTDSANNYSGTMANAANGYTETVVAANLVTARAYTNTSTTAANNYAGFMANAANSYAASLTPDLSPAFNKANGAYTNSNAAFDKANTVASDLSNTATAANNYAGFMANSANAYAASLTPDLSPAFNKANAAYTVANAGFDKANTVSFDLANTATSANNYAGAMANAANGFAQTIVDANLITARAYTNTSTTAANNYAGAMANAANSYATSLTPDLSPAFNKANGAYTVANSGFDKANTVASDLANTAVSANNYAGFMANSANGYTETIVAANLITSRAYTNTSATAANNYAGAMSNSVNSWATATFATITNATAAFDFANGVSTNTTSAFSKANDAYSAANQAGVVANNANTFAVNTFVKKSGDTITGDLTVQGNVTISGNTTYVNTQTLLIGDALVTLNNDIPSNVAPSEDAGIEVKRGNLANVAILWNEGSDKWTFTNDGTVYRSIASNTDVESANNYAGVMANSANGYSESIVAANLVTARAYTNTSTAAANNYAGVMANSANAFAASVMDANLIVSRAYTNTSTTAANNYAGVMANSANAIAVATFATITNAAAAFAFANGAAINTTAAFAFANGISTNTTAAFALANGVVINAAASFGFANSVATNTTAAFAAANQAGVIANAAFTKANTGSGSGLANTSGISFNGDLFFPTGNVAVGASSATFNSVAYRLYVNGAFAANTKSFVIDHPTKPGMKLQHGSLEGPENGVYVRGKIQGKVIELPDYWIGLVDEETITVQLTAIGRSQNLYVVEVSNNIVFIDSENHTEPYCYFTVYGERKDVEKLVVEY
jgi:hypothetical protein